METTAGQLGFSHGGPCNLQQSRDTKWFWPCLSRPHSVSGSGGDSFSRGSRSAGGGVASRQRLRRTSATSAVSGTPRPQTLRDFQVRQIHNNLQSPLYRPHLSEEDMTAGQEGVIQGRLSTFLQAVTFESTLCLQ